MNAAIIGVGTELTTGQIANSNGQWLSLQLKKVGLKTNLHLVVADDHKAIINAIHFATENADLIFITGGLGPTSDDFTRDVILDWTKRKSFFHEASWQHLSDRLTDRGLAVREIQRQQCYYPEGSEILHNRNGTANGFAIDHQGKHFFILPGPPNEIAVIWEDWIQAKMQKLAEKVDSEITLSWDCLGMGESDVALLTEPNLAGTECEIGYRVHLPYVEVKVTFPQSAKDRMSNALAQLDAALKPICVLKNGQDAAELLVQKLAPFKNILLLDTLTGAQAQKRLAPFNKVLLDQNRWTHTTFALPSRYRELFDLVLEIHPHGPDACEIRMHHHNQARSILVESPYQKKSMRHRSSLYYLEKAFLFWLSEI